ncbi:hypothetical protein QZH41_001398 [Actinostola sp. cb2023]|nr:hypothetical protein QZH41_001398 [Actinostola sp. cb2023]
MGATCDNCGKLNHYARVCLGKPQQQNDGRRENRQRNQRPRNINSNNRDYQRNEMKRDNNGTSNSTQRQRARAKHIENQGGDDSSTSSDDECYMHHLQTHHTSQDNGNGKTCTVQINGTDVLIEPDTGSDANIMDEQQLNILQEKAPEVKLKPSKVKLKALKEDLPVIGEADVIIENQTRTVYTTIVIIKGKIDSPALLGRETLEELGMVLIDTTGGLKSPNKSIKNVNQQKPDDNDIKLDEILDRYKDRFTGIGKAMRDGQEIKISVPMKDNAIPIAQKPRRVPYLLTEPLKKRIEEFVENDIIEPVPEHEAITWCSPLVVQPKPKNPKDIRACLDLRLVNKSMLRTRQVQAPITEDFITEFKGCKIFSKLDLNHGYHQFALDEESRRIMTFSTPWGNYRYKRLAFWRTEQPRSV